MNIMYESNVECVSVCEHAFFVIIIDIDAVDVYDELIATTIISNEREAEQKCTYY